MKKIKISIIAVVAIALGIAGSAFTYQSELMKERAFDATYYYVGSNTLAEMQEPDNWELTGTVCNPTGTKPCTIDWVGSRPAFEAHVRSFTSINQVVSECATLKP